MKEFIYKLKLYKEKNDKEIWFEKETIDISPLTVELYFPHDVHYITIEKVEIEKKEIE